MSGEPIDLHHHRERVIGSYVLETRGGPALFDCGPTTAVPFLKAGLAERGLDLTDIRHLILSHIHLGASFDRLWGELAPVPAANIHVVGNRVLGLDCFPTPGHASHHVSYLDRDGTLYAGDAGGVRIAPGRFVLPPCPPPEIDLEAWERTLDEIALRAPGRLALIHFGTFDDVEDHLRALREVLRHWSERVEAGMDEQTFVAAARYDLEQTDPELADLYDEAAPFWHHYLGLERYWRKRREATAGVIR